MTSQARVVYSVDPRSGRPDEHPQTVMRRLGNELNFKIIGSVPQSIFDAWWFWIEYSEKPSLPDYISEEEWLPV